MKRNILFLMVMAVLLLSFTACGGKKVSPEDAEAMAGKWVVVAAEKGGEVNPQEGEITMQFGANGKVDYTIDGETNKYEWEKENSLITIWIKEGSIKRGRTAELEGDTLTLYLKDDDGEAVKLIFGREGTDAANPDQYITEDAVEQPE
ncbi:MAG: lipocalin family protein [Clostridia bacterium]|nr:lipocalin family protein [Clostridia bacterium]